MNSKMILPSCCRQAAWLSLIIPCIWLGGCGSSVKTLPRAGVSGEVTWNGQPLTNALVAFVPQGTVKGPRTVGAITEGKFSLDEAVGPLVGPMRVEITSALEEDEPRDGKAKPYAPERIPAQYNVNSTLSAEVKSGETNKFAFHLQGAGQPPAR
ncbi:MAG: hypothetical protein IAG10_25135 [Planctomycetaceae bacterium]|nr:hypothetical protein [Planctomycetaceae bacterium]